MDVDNLLESYRVAHQNLPSYSELDLSPNPRHQVGNRSEAITGMANTENGEKMILEEGSEPGPAKKGKEDTKDGQDGKVEVDDGEQFQQESGRNSRQSWILRVPPCPTSQSPLNLQTQTWHSDPKSEIGSWYQLCSKDEGASCFRWRRDGEGMSLGDDFFATLSVLTVSITPAATYH